MHFFLCVSLVFKFMNSPGSINVFVIFLMKIWAHVSVCAHFGASVCVFARQGRLAFLGL